MTVGQLIKRLSLLKKADRAKEVLYRHRERGEGIYEGQSWLTTRDIDKIVVDGVEEAVVLQDEWLVVD